MSVNGIIATKEDTRRHIGLSVLRSLCVYGALKCDTC
jgi:hypothetical protein